MTRIKIADSIKNYYSHAGEIWIDLKNRCALCHEETIVMATDSSEDEYGPIYICQKCCNEAFARVK